MRKCYEKINNKAFTLIELMIVIAIIGILMTIVIIAINPLQQIQKAQDSKRRADLNQIKAAMQLYYNDYKYYPTTASSIPFGAAWTVSGTTYMKQIPASDANNHYAYNGVGTCSASSCTDYNITAYLNLPNADDANTLTKCSVTASATINFAVCND